jgi:hypothetical protein
MIAILKELVRLKMAAQLDRDQVRELVTEIDLLEAAAYAARLVALQRGQELEELRRRAASIPPA